MSSVLSIRDFYIHQSVLHPLAVGVPITIFVWLYLRLAPNRILTNFTKFDWIASVTLGSTLSRVITGNADMLDLTRGAISLLVVIIFQLGLAFLTSYVPLARYIRSEPEVIVFRGQIVTHRRNAVLDSDIFICMRRAGVLNLDEIEVLMLEASGGHTIVTRRMMPNDDVVPDSLRHVRQYMVLRKS